MPRRTSRKGGPEDPDHRRQTDPTRIGRILGPRAEEITSAAQTIGTSFSDALAKLGKSGRFGLKPPRAKPDNFTSAKQGIVPIDLQMVELAGDFPGFVDMVEIFLKNAPKPDVR